MILRLVLVLGLAIHKFVWEWLKHGSPDSESKTTSVTSPLLRLVKLGKIIFLVGIVVQTLFVPDFPAISAKPLGLRFAGTVVYFAGLALAITGRIQLGDNWANLEDRQIMSEQELVSSGVYRFIRHPIYAGDLLLLLGLELALNSWLVLGVVALGIVVTRQTLAEEAVLSEAFPDYPHYQKRTKMFIPYVL